MDFCRHMFLGLTVSGALVVPLVACTGPSEPKNYACTANFVYGIDVTVLDGTSGQRVCDATVTAVDGPFTEELQPGQAAAECHYFGVGERPGVYQIRVARSGHPTVSATIVGVSTDGCHVIPVNVTVSLTPPS